MSASYGPPEIVRIAEVPTPRPGDGELLVRVHATTVNRTDCGYRAPHPSWARVFFGLRRPKATILGTEFAGEVVEVGPGVARFEVGDRLFGYVEGTFGAHAEYLTVAEDGSVATIPDELSHVQAAPATEGAHYALMMLRAAQVAPGSDVLVYGATGAIGSAAVQLAKHLGATVTAVCATDHVGMVEGLGADRVIDYTAGDFTRHGRTYDAVIDAVGKATFAQCRPLLRARGIYVSSDLGPYGQNVALSLITPWLPGRTVRFPIPRHDQEMIASFRELLATGAFRPVIDRTYPFAQIVEAYRHAESGRKVGNLVLTVVAPDADRT
ncbi:NAD(P)-dependent alcohol dehydrogenase [Pseudonocardia sp.]|uniref:NAD(P)-dependent alcohol dehydrogenase n=1 Tax=Pseudonocardia sp. TaxID=60912 RepID=UPI00262BE671|nr:NAD(P)-dependent alcohol dehydrogenase [Pseudonocardia sp.]